MKREYLENGIKVFFGALAIVLWQLVSEIRTDVKQLLKGDAEKTIQIQNLENRLQRLETSGSPKRIPANFIKQYAILPSEIKVRS